MTTEELHTLLNRVVGMECWNVGAGGSVGASFSLALGGRVPREKPLKNPAVTDEYRHFEGEGGLLIWCTWRLDGPGDPVTSGDEDEEHIVRGLDSLLGKRVEAIRAEPPAWDMTVSFTGELRLHVFCDHIPGNPSIKANWDFWIDKTAVYAGPGYDLELEHRQSHSAELTHMDRIQGRANPL